jgi:hypothetical protein
VYDEVTKAHATRCRFDLAQQAGAGGSYSQLKVAEETDSADAPPV